MLYHENAAPTGIGSGAVLFKGFPANEEPQNSQNIINLQAARLRRRFVLTAEMALVVAYLAYGTGGAR
jgi:hypothetical protein